MHKLFSVRRLSWLVSVAVFGGLTSCGNGQNKEAGESYTSSQGAKDSSIAVTGRDFSSGTDTNSVQQSAGNTSADWLLIPGVSAGQTKINEDAEGVYKRLGTPDGGDAAMQKAVAIWYSHHDSTAHSIAIYTARNPNSPAIARILQIRITSPSFTTKNGIHTSSSLADIQSKFTVKQTETYEDAGANYKVYDSKEGIAFEINAGGKCVAIIIHEAGVIGEGTYLKFRTTNKFIDRSK